TQWFIKVRSDDDGNHLRDNESSSPIATEPIRAVNLNRTPEQFSDPFYSEGKLGNGCVGIWGKD
ncbi:hypothetical protein AVEN_99453-1, partial [Araneus ventricosus]